MSFAMTPSVEHAFRHNTAKFSLQQAMKKCAGPCNRLRSVGQFAADDKLCAICRRRA